MMVTLPAKCQDVSELLSTEHAREKEEKQRCLLRILSSLRFLARQSCPFRGHNETDVESNEETFISFANFVQRMMKSNEFHTCMPLHAFTAAISHMQLHSWLQRKEGKYTSHDIQNELLKLMALHMLRRINASLHAAEYFAFMLDESTD